MSVRKFRSVTEMSGVEPSRPLDPENFRTVCDLTELAFGLRPWRLKPGVHKFRSFEEASFYREQCEKQQAREVGPGPFATDRPD